jgi:hypothetical protein
MNNTFNITRFGKFFAMEFRQFRNIILILLGVTLIDLVISMTSYSFAQGMIVTTFENMDMDEIDPAIGKLTLEEFALGVNPFRFGGAFGILLLILPFIFYNFVYHPTKSLTYTMLPASWLEKFTSAWAMCVIAVPILIFAFSLLVAFIGDLAGAQISYHSLNLKPFLVDIYFPTVAMQSFFFWAVFWFKRKKIQKTILLVVIFLIALIGVSAKILPYFFDHGANIKFADTLLATLLPYIIGVVMLFFWVAALFKFRRTQI